MEKNSKTPMIKRSIKILTSGVIATSLSLSSVAVAQNKKTERPPQFVLLAFDGSFDLSFWKESREFAKRNTLEGKPMKWTYFVSGVYWLNEKNYPLYMPPHIESQYATVSDRQAEVERRLREANNPALSSGQKRKSRASYSEIGFGDAKADVAERINQTNLAFEEGHEIASHANGHFKGGSSGSVSRKWSLKQWTSEFQQFIDLIFNAYRNNGIENKTRYASGYSFTPQDIVGFRAPTLDTNQAMFETMADFNYKYDTSGLNSSAEKATAWPKKTQRGVWVFPLGYIEIVGTNKKTASMDYNFYVVQSREVEDKANKDKYRDQMYNSYMKYFNDNYYGNRAAVHIGHHFSKWNGGAYWEAMQKFSQSVCGMKEVKCGTYQEYVQWLEDQNKQDLANYAAGAFNKSSRPANLKALQIVGGTETKLTLEDGVFKASALLDRRSKMLNYKVALKLNNKLQEGTELSLEKIHSLLPAGSKAVVSSVVLNTQGDEIDSFSLKISDLGTATEKISDRAIEERAALGDLPEAHAHDHLEEGHDHE